MSTKTTARNVIATITVAGALALGGAGIAAAADGNPGAAPAGAEAGHPRLGVRHGALKTVTETLGVSRADLRTALAGGQTIAQYATSLGKDPHAVVTALVAAGNRALDEAVAAGRVTAERADRVRAKLPAIAERIVNRQWPKVMEHAAAKGATA